MRKPKVATGDKFGYITVGEFITSTPQRGRMFECRCRCGNTLTVSVRDLNSGNTKSCGCARSESLAERNKKSAKHNMSHHPLYDVYRGMIRRCYDKSRDDYKNYGGRGIRVCKAWYRDRKKFFDWCLANGWKAGLQINRIDNDLGYKPKNCNFVTCKDNNNNRRSNVYFTFKGKKLSARKAWEKYNPPVEYRTFVWRIKHGWPPKKALGL